MVQIGRTGDLRGTPADTAHIGFFDDPDITVEDGLLVEKPRREKSCLHEKLEESKSPLGSGGAHALSCNCPLCSITC